MVHLGLFGNYIHRMIEASRAAKPIGAHPISEAVKDYSELDKLEKQS